MYFIESNTSAGHCPAINQGVRAATRRVEGMWPDAQVTCLIHELIANIFSAQAKQLTVASTPEATKSLKGI